MKACRASAEDIKEDIGAISIEVVVDQKWNPSCQDFGERVWVTAGCPPEDDAWGRVLGAHR
jgi:hypothetical protein